MTILASCIYDIEVAKVRIDEAYAYAEQHGIRFIDLRTQQGLDEFLVRASFPRGTFQAFRREFGGLAIKKA